MADDRGDGRLVLVVENGDLVAAFRGLHDVFSDGHNSWVVVRRLNFTDADLEQIWEGALHANRTLVTDREDLLPLSSIRIDVVSHVPDDTRIDGATHTFV